MKLLEISSYPINKPSEIRNISDLEFIQYCTAQPTRQTWEHFFKRYNYFIDKRIIKTLYYLGIPYDTDILADIRAGIVEEVVIKNLLKKAENIENFQAWFGVVIKNFTLDWRRKKKSQKNSEQLINRSTISLHDPILGTDDLSIMDTLAQPEKNCNEANYENLYKIKKEIEKLGDRYRLALKLNILFYEDIEDRDLEEIAKISRVSLTSVRKKISHMKIALENKYENVVLKSEYRMSILHEQLIRLSWELKALELSPLKNAEAISKKKKEYNRKETTLRKLQKKRIVMVHPTARQIADLLHISEENALNVNVLLFRAREKLSRYLIR